MTFVVQAALPILFKFSPSRLLPASPLLLAPNGLSSFKNTPHPSSAITRIPCPITPQTRHLESVLIRHVGCRLWVRFSPFLNPFAIVTATYIALLAMSVGLFYFFSLHLFCCIDIDCLALQCFACFPIVAFFAVQIFLPQCKPPLRLYLSRHLIP